MPRRRSGSAARLIGTAVVAMPMAAPVGAAAQATAPASQALPQGDDLTLATAPATCSSD
jgi:hypothetical protein